MTAQTTHPRQATHMRDHRSVLARIEKQSLVWMAARLPRFINSDHLSALGLTAMAAAGASFALYPRSAGIAAPGVVASLALFTGLAFSQIMNPLVAMALLATYLLVSSETYLATHARGVFRMAFLGIGPTELRILIAAGALKAAVAPAVTVPLAGQVALFDLGGVIAIAGMLVAFLAASISNTRALYLAEPLPGAPADVRAA